VGRYLIHLDIQDYLNSYKFKLRFKLYHIEYHYEKNSSIYLSYLIYFWSARVVIIAAVALVHPETPGLQLTHFAPWPREDNFGIVSFAVSFISFFIWNLVKDNKRNEL
jgi:hypothetical protein